MRLLLGIGIFALIGLLAHFNASDAPVNIIPSTGPSVQVSPVQAKPTAKPTHTPTPTIKPTREPTVTITPTVFAIPTATSSSSPTPTMKE